MTSVNCKTIRIRGKLLPLHPPLVMGILNVTPDSFHAFSRRQTETEIHSRIEEILAEGGRIIDIGACSSRPGAAEVSEEEEMKRLASALRIVQTHYPDAIVSVDTFRADVARRSVEMYGASIINDISGGESDADMFLAVARLNVPYILMHMRGTPQTMQQFVTYDNLIVDIRTYFAEKVYKLQLLGVSDILLDPGFGFSKTTAQNFELLRRLDDFAVFGLPLLAGLSRKSMIYKHLHITPDDSLNGTTALNTLALLKGADILRVHDVKAAVEVVQLVHAYSNSDPVCGCASE
ncbi:MAG: dihydropteroate synthase [Tannerellaceae bacterium]|nr:dihydropteroate synthase [Tannerellaceae bacterium]